MPKIFINYRSGDDGFAAVEIANRLSARFGAAEVFRDSTSIPVGTDFEPVLWRNLAASRVVVTVIGPHWLTGAGATNRLQNPEDFVRRELELALRLGLPLVPVLVDGARVPDERDVPDDVRPLVAQLAKQQYRRVHARSADADIAALIETLEELLMEPDRDRPGTVLLARSVAAGGAAELANVIRGAVVDAGLSTAATSHDGDTVRTVQPGAKHGVAMTGDLVRSLRTRIADAGVGPVKLALDHDQRTATPAEMSLGRLHTVLAEPALDAVLAAMSTARLVVALGDDLYRAAVLPGHPSIDRAEYAPLRTADGRTWWIQVPGRPGPRGLPEYVPQRREDPQEAWPNGHRAESRTIYGNAISAGVWTGDHVNGPKVNGDYVMGDKIAGNKTTNVYGAWT